MPSAKKKESAKSNGNGARRKRSRLPVSRRHKKRLPVRRCRIRESRCKHIRRNRRLRPKRKRNRKTKSKSTRFPSTVPTRLPQRTGCRVRSRLRNWNETFLREEKRGAFRTGESKGRAPFARYLYASDFSHRMLVKLRGYTPRNGLPALVLAEKTKPSVLSCLARNEVHVPPLTEKKTVAYGDYFSLQCVSFPPLPDKDGGRDERYASYLTR